MFKLVSTGYFFQPYATSLKRSVNDSLSDRMRTVYAFSIGMIGSMMLVRPNLACAAGHTNEHLQEVANEILQHAIWHQIGHIIGLGSVAAGALGGLLSFQTLGEKDVFHIPRQISKPVLSYQFNPNTKMLEPCLDLPNGKRLVGQEIIDFHLGLRWVQFVQEPVKRS